MNDTSELISVLMPLRTPASELHRHWLNQAVTSILKQSDPGFELIIITQTDTEAHALGLRPKLQQDPRLRIIQRKTPGIVNALNCGIEQARGTLIARMDADDISMPERLALQRKHLDTHPEIDIVSGAIQLFSDNDEIGQGSQYYQQWLNGFCTPDAISKNIFIESPLPHPTWFARRELFEKLNGYRDVTWPEDYDFLLRAWLSGARMEKLPDTILHWREHADRLTRTTERYSTKQFLNAKAWALSKSLACKRKVIILGTGRNAVRFHDALKKYHICVEYFVDLNAGKGTRSKRQISVIDYPTLLSIRNQNNSLIVSVITRRGARAKLQSWFEEHNYSIEKDFVFAG